LRIHCYLLVNLNGSFEHILQAEPKENRDFTAADLRVYLLDVGAELAIVFNKILSLLYRHLIQLAC
jgi:hypothetical protein